MEWRKFTDEQKRAYLRAIDCLRQEKNQITVQQGEIQHKTRWEDFSYAYKMLFKARIIKDNPSFLPANRAFLALFDKELRTHTVCKYTGPMPYWDWSKDVHAGASSQIWKEFGGVNCIKTPSGDKWMTTGNAPQCVTRVYTTLGGQKAPKHLGYQTIGDALKTSLYNELRKSLEKMTDFLLGSIGGMLGNRINAANDPLFVLIIRNDDRIWTYWQGLNAQNAKAYGGHSYDLGKSATVNDPIPLQMLTPDSKATYAVADVMSTKSGKFGGLMSYTYDTIVAQQPRQVPRPGLMGALRTRIAGTMFNRPVIGQGQ